MTRPNRSTITLLLLPLPLGFVLRANEVTRVFVECAPSIQQAAEPTSQAITNADVLKLHTSGMSGETILAKIRSSECRFDTSVDALTQMKGAGIPEAVIVAMLDSAARASRARTADGPQPTVPKEITQDGKKTKLRHTATLFNLRTGKKLLVRYSWNLFNGTGTVYTVLPGGESLTGMFRTIASGHSEWGTIYYSAFSQSQGTAYTSLPGMGTATTTASSQTTTTGTKTKSKSVAAWDQRGAGVASGDKGSVVDCEYVTSAWTAKGHGYCRDNHGDYYRLMF